MDAENGFLVVTNTTSKDLFIYCPLAKLLWHTVNVTYYFPPLAKIANMFGKCVKWSL
jgi:hypothetical protein